MRERIIKIGILPASIFLLGVFISSFFFVPLKANAQEACATPAQVAGVLVSYPACDASGNNCNFTQAKCSWSASSDASKYQVTITEVDSNTVVYNQQVDSTTTSLAVAITQGKTYQCSVAAVNSCGNLGPAGTHSLLCGADAGASTPTSAPTSVPTTAPTAIPTPMPTPGIAFTTTASLGLGMAVMIIAGFAFLIL
jgi:hypothetical protein